MEPLLKILTPFADKPLIILVPSRSLSCHIVETGYMFLMPSATLMKKAPLFLEVES